MKISTTLVVLLTSFSAQAALPPTAESLRRLRAITESVEVFKVLGSARIVTSIEGHGNGQYSVMTNDCALSVTVEAVRTSPPMMVPPLKVNVGQMNCLPGI